MNEQKLKAEILLEIADALNQGAAGPCDYWYRRLAVRLIKRVDGLTSDSSRQDKAAA